MDADRSAESLSPAQRYMILATVVLGASLYSTALLTTSTILPQMQGAMSATQDEIAWAMTFNILATAVVTPMTGWLVARFGSKRVMTLGILSFSIATFLCGLSQTLDALWCGASSRVPPARRLCRCRKPSCSTRFHAGSTPWCCRCSAWRSAWPP